MKLNPYIMFAGNAEDALNFYRDSFNGEIKYLGRYGESPMQTDESNKNKIMHSTFVFDDNVIMISDSMPGQAISSDGNVHLSIDFDNTGQMETVFNKLAQGGTVTMPLQDTFWGARFGMLKDKFDINWMFNCDKKQ